MKCPQSDHCAVEIESKQMLKPRLRIDDRKSPAEDLVDGYGTDQSSNGNQYEKRACCNSDYYEAVDLIDQRAGCQLAGRRGRRSSLELILGKRVRTSFR